MGMINQAKTHKNAGENFKLHFFKPAGFVEVDFELWET